MSDQFLLLDVSSAPIADAVSYLEPVSAPSNYKDQAKIDAYVAEKTSERIAILATDIDLAQVTGIAWWRLSDSKPVVMMAGPSEAHLLKVLASEIWRSGELCRSGQIGRDSLDAIITYGGFNFDLPLLMRRARYLGVDFPTLNLDRYRSPHIDLCELLSDRDWKRRRPLSFYVRRLGWTDLRKPLSGEEEARVLESGRWAELEASLHHDITAIHRLSLWLKIWTPAADTQVQEVIP